MRKRTSTENFSHEFQTVYEILASGPFFNGADRNEKNDAYSLLSENTISRVILVLITHSATLSAIRVVVVKSDAYNASGKHYERSRYG